MFKKLTGDQKFGISLGSLTVLIVLIGLAAMSMGCGKMLPPSQQYVDDIVQIERQVRAAEAAVLRKEIGAKADSVAVATEFTKVRGEVATAVATEKSAREQAVSQLASQLAGTQSALVDLRQEVSGKAAKKVEEQVKAAQATALAARSNAIAARKSTGVLLAEAIRKEMADNATSAYEFWGFTPGKDDFASILKGKSAKDAAENLEKLVKNEERVVVAVVGTEDQSPCPETNPLCKEGLGTARAKAVIKELKLTADPSEWKWKVGEYPTKDEARRVYVFVRVQYYLITFDPLGTKKEAEDLVAKIKQAGYEATFWPNTVNRGTPQQKVEYIVQVRGLEKAAAAAALKNLEEKKITGGKIKKG